MSTFKLYCFWGSLPPDDPEKDFIQYKTGLAKAIGENLTKRSYLLRERYYLENGTKTDNATYRNPAHSVMNMILFRKKQNLEILTRNASS